MQCVAPSVNSQECTSHPLPLWEGTGRAVKLRPSATALPAVRLFASHSQYSYLPGMRLALKTGTYSLMHLTVAIAVTYAITQDWRAALAVGLIEPGKPK